MSKKHLQQTLEKGSPTFLARDQAETLSVNICDFKKCLGEDILGVTWQCIHPCF